MQLKPVLVLMKVWKVEKRRGIYQRGGGEPRKAQHVVSGDLSVQGSSGSKAGKVVRARQ